MLSSGLDAGYRALRLMEDLRLTADVFGTLRGSERPGVSAYLSTFSATRSKFLHCFFLSLSKFLHSFLLTFAIIFELLDVQGSEK